jgi:hypothetical protein
LPLHAQVALSASTIEADLPTTLHLYNYQVAPAKAEQHKFLQQINDAYVNQWIYKDLLQQMQTDKLQLSALLPWHQQHHTFLQAQQAMQQDAYERAIYLYTQTDNALLSNDELVLKNYNLAYAYLQVNKQRKAEVYSIKEIVSVMNGIRSIDSKYKSAGNYYYAVLQYLSGNYKEAINGLQGMDSTENYSAVMPFVAAQSYYQIGSVTRAEEIVQQYFSKSQTSARYQAPMVRLAMQLAFEQEQYQKVLDYGARVGDAAAMEATQRYNYAYAAMQLQDDAVAEYAFGTLLREDNDTLVANCYYNLAHLAYKHHDEDKALKNLQFIGDNTQLSKQQNLVIWENLVRLSLSKRDDATATIYALKLARDNNKDAQNFGIYALCLILPNAADTDQAIATLQDFEDNPTAASTLYSMLISKAQKALSKAQFAESKAAARKAMQYTKVPNEIEVLDYFIADVNYRSKDYSALQEQQQQLAKTHLHYCDITWLHINALLQQYAVSDALKIVNATDFTCSGQAYASYFLQLKAIEQTMLGRDSLFHVAVDSVYGTSAITLCDSLLQSRYCKHADSTKLLFVQCSALKKAKDKVLRQQLFSLLDYSIIAADTSKHIGYYDIAASLKDTGLKNAILIVHDSALAVSSLAYTLQQARASYDIAIGNKQAAKQRLMALAACTISAQQKKDITKTIKGIK